MRIFPAAVLALLSLPIASAHAEEKSVSVTGHAPVGRAYSTDAEVMERLQSSHWFTAKERADARAAGLLRGIHPMFASDGFPINFAGHAPIPVVDFARSPIKLGHRGTMPALAGPAGTKPLFPIVNVARSNAKR